MAVQNPSWGPQFSGHSFVIFREITNKICVDPDICAVEKQGLGGWVIHIS